MSEPRTPAQWQVAGQSVLGAAHARAGLPCQDAILWREGQGFVVLAVADGHGSERSPHSDEGARIAVEVAVELLYDLYAHSGLAPDHWSAFKHCAEEQLPRTLVRTWTERVQERHAARQGKGEAPDGVLLQYGATLLAVLAAPEFLLFWQLGDGDILRVADDGSVTRPIPKDERLIANETTSLCTPQAWREVRVVFQPLLDSRPRSSCSPPTAMPIPSSVSRTS
jgi:serine/threonine protein phosphatase PrpC